MANAFQWLSDSMRDVLRLIPRLSVIPATHRAVLFGPGGSAKDKGAGLVLWWPVISQLVRVPVTVQSIQISARCFPHGQGDELLPRTAVVALAVQYRVVDVVLAALNALDLHALVDNRSQAALSRHWRGDVKTAEAAVADAKREISGPLRARFGVDLERMDVTHCGIAVALMRLGDYAYADAEPGRETG